MNGYKLTRDWFSYTRENLDKVECKHTAMYLYIVELFNVNQWVSVLGLPTDYTMASLNIKSYKTYKKILDDLVDFNKIEFVERSKNIFTSNKIKLVKNTNASPKRLQCDTEVTTKENGKQVQSDYTIDNLYKLLNKETIKLINLNIKDVSIFLNKNISEILKEKDSKIIYPFEQKEFIEHWQIWKDYKKQEHSFKYKSEITEQAALVKLSKMTNDYKVAIKILMQSIENGYKGFFELKNDNNGKQGNGFGETVEQRAIRLTREFQEEQGINR